MGNFKQMESTKKVKNIQELIIILICLTFVIIKFLFNHLGESMLIKNFFISLSLISFILFGCAQQMESDKTTSTENKSELISQQLADNNLNSLDWIGTRVKVLETTDNYIFDGKSFVLNKARMAPLARFEIMK